MILRRSTLVSGLLLLAAAGRCLAEPAADWASGQQAFAAGDYDSALVYFETARDQGLAGPAVHYNIAVCRYKLGQWPEAALEFQLIATTYPTMRGLAEYNLGLVARQTGDTEAARAHFLRAWELSPGDDKLRILASKAVAGLPAPAGGRASGDWSALLGLRAGHDSNVALRDELGLPAGQTADSPMSDLFASIQGPWRSSGGLRVEGSAYLVRYFDADGYDQSSLQLGGVYDWRPGDWRIELGADWSFGTLGGDDFERTTGASLRLGHRAGRRGQLELRLQHDDIEGVDAAYAGISGSRERADVRYRWRAGATYLALRYGVERNDRDDPGVSPDRQLVTADYRYEPERGWGFEASAELRSSDYDGLATPRSEDLAAAGIALTRTLPADWLLLLQLRRTANDSSDPDFSYDRTQVTLGAYKLF